jgi:hypothetical protein
MITVALRLDSERCKPAKFLITNYTADAFTDASGADGAVANSRVYLVAPRPEDDNAASDRGPRRKPN